MISSTARDLPEHRKQIMDACLRQDMFPIMMEHLSASDSHAIAASIQMVNVADIYVLVLAHCYGHVAKADNPKRLSITELEYDHAVERRIPRLVFLMHEDHLLKAASIEKGSGAVKLDKFKRRVQGENVVNFFTSPEDLRAYVIDGLSKQRRPDITTFHYIGEIPLPPESYIAHQYTLMTVNRLIGRKPELNALTDWINGKRLELGVSGRMVRVLSVIAIGGMGKSALTWKWFNDIAPKEMKPLVGRMWWSFYESDATFENFVARAFAYVTRRPLEEVLRMPESEREAGLLAVLDREPYLIVLDGLERILVAYARMDASRLDGSEIGRERNLRKSADPHIGRFLQKLTHVNKSRFLISSRLYPSELETQFGEPLTGAFRMEMRGLSDDDAVELWRAFDVSGSRDEIQAMFATFDRQPLLIQALAGEVRRFPHSPGNFSKWKQANPGFAPESFPQLQAAMGHVLEFALQGLNEKTRDVLRTIAGFRMPARYDALAQILVGGERLFAEERELDLVLAELQDRGILGWDKRANRYDLHPLVRGVVWSGLADDARRGVYTSLHAHFEAVPKIDDYHKVNSLEDLTPAIELYNTLIGLGRYDDAGSFFYERLSDATLYRLSASRQRIELLEMLFPDGLEESPRLSRQVAQAYALNALGQGYQFFGQPGRAAQLFQRANAIFSEMKNEGYLSVGLRNLSLSLRLSGALCESSVAARRALVIMQKDRFDEGVSLYLLGFTLAARGLVNESGSALQRALRIRIAQSEAPGEGLVNCFLAQRALWRGKFAVARSFADRAWELAYVLNNENDFIRAARVQGEAALGLNDHATADERLHHALTRARIVNLVEEELAALVALAELRRRQGDHKAARELLDDGWEAAERGPYPLIHTDAFNVLAQIERDEGNNAAAIEAATKAYRLAWCDGPPFAYHWGLEKATQHLKELGAPEPEMPRFDETKFEPMPEVEINPHDEFYVDEESIDSN
jgi:tetratricopeptide (TPR) repeat protein